jgi:hypothetical protein
MKFLELTLLPALRLHDIWAQCPNLQPVTSLSGVMFQTNGSAYSPPCNAEVDAWDFFASSPLMRQHMLIETLNNFAFYPIYSPDIKWEVNRIHLPLNLSFWISSSFCEDKLLFMI